MKRARFGIVLAAAALLATSVSALTFTNGEEFHSMCGGAFGAGFLNYNLCHGFMKAIASDMANRHLICLPAGTPERNIVITVQDYMREHPERLRLPAREITAEALARAYPCRRRP